MIISASTIIGMLHGLFNIIIISAFYGFRLQPLLCVFGSSTLIGAISGVLFRSFLPASMITGEVMMTQQQPQAGEACQVCADGKVSQECGVDIAKWDAEAQKCRQNENSGKPSLEIAPIVVSSADLEAGGGVSGQSAPMFLSPIASPVLLSPFRPQRPTTAAIQTTSAGVTWPDPNFTQHLGMAEGSTPAPMIGNYPCLLPTRSPLLANRPMACTYSSSTDYPNPPTTHSLRPVPPASAPAGPTATGGAVIKSNISRRSPEGASGRGMIYTHSFVTDVSSNCGYASGESMLSLLHPSPRNRMCANKLSIESLDDAGARNVLVVDLREALQHNHSLLAADSLKQAHAGGDVPNAVQPN